MQPFRTRICLTAALLLITLSCLPLRQAAAQNPPPKPMPEVQALLDKGQEAAHAHRWDEALRYDQEALEQARALKDQAGQATALTATAIIHWGIGQYPKALELFQQALTICQAIGYKRGEANALNNIGIVYWNTGQPEKALEFHQKALTICQAIGDKSGEANTLNSIGAVYSNTGQLQKALEFYQKALTIRQAIGDKGGEAATLTNIGVVYGDTGQYQKALEFYQKALPIFQAIGDKRGEEATLTNIGNVYLDTGQPEKALEFHQKALTICQAIGDKSGEAATLNSIGNVYQDTGRPGKALEFLQRALTIRQAIGDKRGEAATLNSIGIVYLGTGQYQKALEFYQKALTIKQAIGDKGGEANTLANIGVVYWNTGQLQKALEFYQKALTIYQAIGDKGGEAATLNNIGIVYGTTGQYQKALDYFQRALPLDRAVGNKMDEANRLTDIGNVYRYTGQYPKALEFYQKALTIRQAIGDNDGEAITLYSIGIVYERQGRLALAEQNLEQAVQLEETVRADIGALSEAKTAYLVSHIDVYHRLVHLLLREHKTAQAFALAQKTKARSLLDLMAGGRVVYGQPLTDKEREQERQLRGQTDLLNRQMVQEGVQNKPGAKKRFTALQAQLRQAESDLQTFEDSLYALHPDLARKRVATTTTLLELARLLPPDTALLEYVTLETGDGKDRSDRTALFVVTAQGGQAKVVAYNLPITRKALIRKVDAFRTACSDPRKPYRRQARALYRLLIAPAEKRLVGKKRLIVCPDGPLWDVPFAALMPDNRFLAQRHEIAYAYSATGMQAALLARSQPGRAPPSRTLLAMANPDFGDEKRFGDNPDIADQRPIVAPSRPIVAPSRPLLAPSRPILAPSRPIVAPSRDLYLPRGGRLTPLKGTQREAEMLKKEFPDAVLYLGKEAQKATVLSEAGKYRYLHFATHGFFNDAAPMLSSIVLAQPPPGSDDDGFLTARDIFDLDLSAELVVLSACNTARGEKRSGEGIVGLTWALFVAGAPTQVLSQWSVDDVSTAMLMEDFYAGVKRGQAKGAALRKAAVSLMRGEKQQSHVGNRKSKIENRKYSHPYYWAPFVLVGDWG
jgi:CHAT domain-containing protein/tetratricopeptide (TPR) repeat protein